jgi:DNA-directed RNA polymerase specialized sigma24 family protein
MASHADDRQAESDGCRPIPHQWQFATQEVQASVRRTLTAIPTQFRSAVILRDLEGLSYEEIAEVLEVTVRTAKSRILRGWWILKELLGPLVRQFEKTESTRSDRAERYRAVARMLEQLKSPVPRSTRS